MAGLREVKYNDLQKNMRVSATWTESPRGNSSSTRTAEVLPPKYFHRSTPSVQPPFNPKSPYYNCSTDYSTRYLQPQLLSCSVPWDVSWYSIQSSQLLLSILRHAFPRSISAFCSPLRLHRWYNGGRLMPYSTTLAICLDATPWPCYCTVLG